MRGCTAITSITAQNNKAVHSVHPLTAQQLIQQLDALAQEYTPSAIKLGLVGSVELATVLKDYLSQFKVPIVFDPVIWAGSGSILVQGEETIRAIRDLLPLCSVLTPNIQEAQILSGHRIDQPKDMLVATDKLLGLGAKSVLVKGGHADFEQNYCWDYWADGNAGFWMRVPRKHGNYRGTGCSLSSALAAALVNGWSTALDDRRRLHDALVIACAYVQQGIRRASISRRAETLMHGEVSWELCDLPQIYQDYGASSTYNIPQYPNTSFGLYPIVDNSAWVDRLSKTGVRTIQLRIKNAIADEDMLNSQIATAQAIAKANHTRLFVNDYWQLAIAHHSDGVHLGQSDLDDADLHAIANHGLYVGISTHGWWEIARALTLKPSYIAFGPVFATDTKIMPFAPLGIERLAFWAKLTEQICPRVAIGGISIENASKVKSTGVEGIAVVSAISVSTDWRTSVRRLQEVCN